MSQNSVDKSDELYQKIETLFFKEHFHLILKFEPVLKEIESYGFDSKKTKCLYEIFARTYIELNHYSKAISVIDKKINLLNNKDMCKVEYADDLLVFTLLKMDVLEKSEDFREEYKSILCYEKQGGNDSQVLNRKIEIEESLFMKYVKVNKYILYLILLAVLLVNLDLIPSNNDYLPVLTSIALVWYVLNYIMSCRVKRLYLKLIRLIYS